MPDTDTALTPAETPTFVTTDGRTGTVALDWPIMFQGKLWSEIPLKRCTGLEMRAYAEKMRAASEGAFMLSPVLGDLPQAVFDALDYTDLIRVNEAAEGFLLPRSPAAPASGPTPASGSGSSPS